MHYIFAFDRGIYLKTKQLYLRSLFPGNQANDLGISSAKCYYFYHSKDCIYAKAVHSYYDEWEKGKCNVQYGEIRQCQSAIVKSLRHFSCR